MDAALALSLTSLAGVLVTGGMAASSRRASERFRVSSEARSRLQVATGTLQLELFLETRSFARRFNHYFRESGEDHSLETIRGESRPGPYHDGGMMIYRILRPLTVGEIIEKQTLPGDFLLDPAMVDMVRFGQAAVEMLTGDGLGARFDGKGFVDGFDMTSCWDVGEEGPDRFQRIRGSYLRCGAAALLAPESPAGPEPRRCLTHAEFCKLWERPEQHPEASRPFHEGLAPMKATIHRFNRYENPILWLRLVGYAHACEKFYARMRGAMFDRSLTQRLRSDGREPAEIETLEVDVVKMLRDLVEGDEEPGPLSVFIAENAGRYAERFDAIVDSPL
jgi:hypothetical protein